MNDNFIAALYSLYPQIVKTDGGIAYDDQDNVVSYDAVAVQEQSDKMSCKQQAQKLLYETDWTSIADVGNPSASNPYLLNQAAFIAYRSQIRALAVNPVADPVWPTKPTEQWSS